MATALVEGCGDGRDLTAGGTSAAGETVASGLEAIFFLGSGDVAMFCVSTAWFAASGVGVMVGEETEMGAALGVGEARETLTAAIGEAVGSGEAGEILLSGVHGFSSTATDNTSRVFVPAARSMAIACAEVPTFVSIHLSNWK